MSAESLPPESSMFKSYHDLFASPELLHGAINERVSVEERKKFAKFNLMWEYSSEEILCMATSQISSMHREVDNNEIEHILCKKIVDSPRGCRISAPKKGAKKGPKIFLVDLIFAALVSEKRLTEAHARGCSAFQCCFRNDCFSFKHLDVGTRKFIEERKKCANSENLCGHEPKCIKPPPTLEDIEKRLTCEREKLAQERLKLAEEIGDYNRQQQQQEHAHGEVQNQLDLSNGDHEIAQDKSSSSTENEIGKRKRKNGRTKKREKKRNQRQLEPQDDSLTPQQVRKIKLIELSVRKLFLFLFQASPHQDHP